MELITLPECAVTWRTKKKDKYQFTIDLVDKNGKLYSQENQAEFYCSETHGLTLSARVDFSYFLRKSRGCRTLIENGGINYTELELESIYKLIKSTIERSFVDFINTNF